MLDIIKSIINYIPKESVNDMLNIRIASIAATKVDKGYEGYTSIRNLEEMYPSTIEMKLVENKVNKDKIIKSNCPEDILMNILDEFKKDYKCGECCDDGENHIIELSKINTNNYLHREMAMASNKIYSRGRVGPGNVALIPKSLFSYTPPNILSMKTIINPLEDDKAYVINCKENISEIKYHLITDSKIPGKRECKINHILNKDNREINYYIMKIQGFAESVVVFDVV